jgi:hypothetical protein
VAGLVVNPALQMLRNTTNEANTQVDLNAPLFQDNDAPLIITMTDLHMGRTLRGPLAYGPEVFVESVRNALLSKIEQILPKHPGSCIVISGDCAARHPEDDGFISEGNLQFLEQLQQLCWPSQARIVFTIGNHDPQHPVYFWRWLLRLRELGIVVLTNVDQRYFAVDEAAIFQAYTDVQIKPNETSVNDAQHAVSTLESSLIVGNTLFFPYCLNFDNQLGYGCDVFTPRGFEYIKDFDQDSECRDGRIDNLTLSRKFDDGKGPKLPKGAPNPLAYETAMKFKIYVEALAQANPDGELIVDFVCHDYYIRLLSFLERVTELWPEVRLAPEILARLKMIALCGHHHQQYSIDKEAYITGSDERRIAVPCIMGCAGIYGSHLFVVNPSNWHPQKGQEVLAPKNHGSVQVGFGSDPNINDGARLRYFEEVTSGATLPPVLVPQPYVAPPPAPHQPAQAGTMYRFWTGVALGSLATSCCLALYHITTWYRTFW